jgi:hypothetical protein
MRETVARSMSSTVPKTGASASIGDAVPKSDLAGLFLLENHILSAST